MPTRPFDQPCDAEVVQAALGATRAAQVHHHHRVAARGEVAGEADRLAVRVARLGQDPRAVAVGERAVVRRGLEDHRGLAGRLRAHDLEVQLAAVEGGDPDDVPDGLVLRLREALGLGVVLRLGARRGRRDEQHDEDD